MKVMRFDSKSKIFQKKSTAILLIFGLFFTLSVVAHFGRTAHKGSNYELSDYQDSLFYFAMTKNLFHKPASLLSELTQIPEMNSAAEATLDHFFQNQEQWHLENGLSHSPPYVYRILQPVIVMSLGLFGISGQLGFLLVSSFGLGLLGVFLYLLLINSRVSSKLAIFFSTCFSIAAINLIQNPMYTDYLFLGLIASCIYFQKKGYLRFAFIISSIAVLNRETSLIIWIYLVALYFVNTKTNLRLLKSHLSYVALAPLAFFIPRFLIPVPNSNYPIIKLIIGFLTARSMILFLFLVFFVLICVLLPYLLPRNKISTEDRLLFILGMVGLFVSCSLGGNWNRFLLTLWPMFLFYDSLTKVDSRNSVIVLSSFGLLFLAANDFLSFNSNFNITYIKIMEIIFLIGANLVINPNALKRNFSKKSD